MTPAAAIKALQFARTGLVAALAGGDPPEAEVVGLLSDPVLLNNLLEIAEAADATFGSRSRRERLRLDAALQALARNVARRTTR